ncbi:hypothetical protein K438DRAFT_1590627 [Mycena galopus ATCC 62051]|nr:hypothetical protein K438DRAFT_1590627 [Mycena galopus ATCC 62051]
MIWFGGTAGTSHSTAGATRRNLWHRHPKLILDADGRIVAILLGRPEADDWDNVMARLVDLMDGVRKCGVRRNVFVPKLKQHRRGNFYTLRAGVTKGPGQKKPGNLTHSKEPRKLLDLILRDRAAGRVAGFQSSGLAHYAPKLYRYQHNTLKRLFELQPELEQPFRNSVFPTVTFNLGPDVVTPEHLDMLNNPSGLCAVSSAGKFNHHKGGHIYLKQLKLACEFPSGSTVLLLSGACEHGNTPIQKNETHYSITQYAAGALFRWAAYGYQSVKSVLAQAGGAAQKKVIDGEPGERAALGLGLLSTADGLAADREEVFGGNRGAARSMR